MGRRLALLGAALFLSGCYAYRSTAGHLGLLWRRESIDKALKDSSLSPGRRAVLELVRDAKKFSVETLALDKSRDYSSWTPVEGDAVTWLVYACPRNSLKPKTYMGYPYKGHFKKEWADKEAARWEEDGFDAAVLPAAAYNTPLPFADPLPSSVLRWPPGDLAELLIHEAVHGTLGPEESVATWIGEKGAEQFLTARYGPDSPELLEWKASTAKAETRAVLFDELAKLLEADYKEGGKNREKLFLWAREVAIKRKVDLGSVLNNATVAAHRVYRGDPKVYEDLFEANGRDWKKFVYALRQKRAKSI